MEEQALSTLVTSNHIDLAIMAWLDSKRRRSGSAKTHKAYEETLWAFRSLLRQHARDLDPFIHLLPDANEQEKQQALTELALTAQGFAGQSVRERLIAEATYNQRLAILSSFYTFANKRGFFQCENPIAKVERSKVQAYKNAQPIDAQEIAQRMQTIDRTTKQGARDYAMLAIFLQTGRRLSEVIALRWRHVQVQGSKIILVFENCKGGKTMRDTLTPGIANALLEWLVLAYGANLRRLHPEAPIWISFTRQAERDGTHPTTLPTPLTIRSVANICEKHLGTSKVHVTRHTWARTMEDAGAKVSEIQARLGHESLATTGRYLAALKQADNRHADTLASLFGLS